MTSVLFGLMHSFNPEVEEFGFFTMMPQYVAFGLIFGIITILRRWHRSRYRGSYCQQYFSLHYGNRINLPHCKPRLFMQQQNIYPLNEFAALLVTGIIFIIVLKIIFKWEGFSLLLGRVEKLNRRLIRVRIQMSSLRSVDRPNEFGYS